MNIEELKAKYLQNDFKLKGEFLSDGERENVVERSRKYAGWTIPTLFPEEDVTDSEEMQTDYQSVGAQAVTNLSNKIMMALFQPSRPFFRMNLTEKQRQEVESTGLDGAQIDSALATAERKAMNDLNATNARIVMHDAIQQLIITGNALLYTPLNETKMTAYSLEDYMIKRDLRGETTKVIIRETKALVSLSDELIEIARSQKIQDENEVTIYTCIQRIDEGKYLVWQEMEDLCYCHKKIGVYKKDDLPWIPLTWNLARGKDYGTGLVELYAGAFHKLSNLSEAINDYSLVITDVKNLVNPAGMTDVRELTQAQSGAYVHGRAEDIFVHQPVAGASVDFLSHQYEVTSRLIGAAFLLNSAVTRDAERVTAQEIRMQAQELESSLGGVYSRLAAELQLPLAKRLMKNLNKIFGDIEPVIVTGLESLSRNSELDNFRAFMQDMIVLADVPDEVKVWMDFGNVIATLGAGHGVDYKKFLKDEDVVKKEQEAAMQRNAKAAGMEAGAIAQAEGQVNGRPTG